MRNALKILAMLSCLSFAMEWAWQALFYTGQPFAESLYHYRYLVGNSILFMYFSYVPKEYFLNVFGFVGLVSSLSRLVYRILKDVQGEPMFSNNEVWWVFILVGAVLMIAKSMLDKKWK